MKIEPVTIIGVGPAGIATAIQLKRYGIEPILFEKDAIGGLLRNANLVENYPGFPYGISGLKLADLFKKQLRGASIKVLFEEVIKVDTEDELFVVETSKRVFYSKIVVVASGTKPMKFTDCESPEEDMDKIFYEVCPILKVKKKRIVIVGAGDVAFDYALNLVKNNEITLLNRGKRVKCLPLLSERAKMSPGIAYYENTKISRIISDSSKGIFLECIKGGKNSEFFAHYLIFAIGREPQLDFLSERLKKNVREMENKGIIYFVGDVKNRDARQAAIASGEGIMAGMKIYRKLKEA
jgi:thioredoxin reductase